MRRLQIIFFLTLFSFLAKAQDKIIGDVKQRGNNFEVLDEKGNYIKGITMNGKLLGVGKDFFVIAKDGYLESYSYRCEYLGGIRRQYSKVRVINNTIYVCCDPRIGGEDQYDRKFRDK